MPKEVLVDAYVMINAVELSDHVRSLELPLSLAEIDKTCMGDGSVTRLNGLKDGQLRVTFAQDFAAGSVDATLWGVFNGGVAVAIKVRPVNTTIGATNPEYQFNAVLSSYTPIGGQVGQLHEAPVNFSCDGTVTRATSA